MQNLSRDTVPWRSSHIINHMSSTCDHRPVNFYGDENFTASSGSLLLASVGPLLHVKLLQASYANKIIYIRV